MSANLLKPNCPKIFIYQADKIVGCSGVTQPPEALRQIFNVGEREGGEENTFFEPYSLKKGVQKDFPDYDVKKVKKMFSPSMYVY